MPSKKLRYNNLVSPRYFFRGQAPPQNTRGSATIHVQRVTGLEHLVTSISVALSTVGYEVSVSKSGATPKWIVCNRLEHLFLKLDENWGVPPNSRKPPIDLKSSYIHLVGGLEHFLIFHLLGMSTSQLTNSLHHFSEGVG